MKSKKVTSWSSEPADDAEAIRERAAESAGFAMNLDAFDARRAYAANWGGTDGPERHLAHLIRNAERETDKAIELGKAGRK